MTHFVPYFSYLFRRFRGHIFWFPSPHFFRPKKSLGIKRESLVPVYTHFEGFGAQKRGFREIENLFFCFISPFLRVFYFVIASCTATAQATDAPTMGLLPMPIKPIISTWAGTEDEPANCASECILPMVSVMP